MRMEAAQEKAAEYGVQAVTMDRLLADPDIQIVINLTVPLAHAQVSMQVVEAGKRVYFFGPDTIWSCDVLRYHRCGSNCRRSHG
jgi:hypothetical protein